MDTRNLALLMKAVVETVAEADPTIGAPSGPMYAAFMHVGMSLESYQRLMDGIVGAGLISRRGDCYSITPAGRTFLAKTEGLL
jgi:hypothetical protein